MGEATDKQTERGEWGARKGGEERKREKEEEERMWQRITHKFLTANHDHLEIWTLNHTLTKWWHQITFQNAAVSRFPTKHRRRTVRLKIRQKTVRQTPQRDLLGPGLPHSGCGREATRQPKAKDKAISMRVVGKMSVSRCRSCLRLSRTTGIYPIPYSGCIQLQVSISYGASSFRLCCKNFAEN